MNIHLWLMSCRVIGRTVENTLLGQVCEAAEKQGKHLIRGTYIPTAKNALVKNKYEEFGFVCVDTLDDGTTIWEYDLLTRGPIASPYITIETLVEA
ncbi:MAG: hypothetical protein R3C04_11025 [Hyphomonas sp.]